jgi:hypothetical protein
MKLYVSKNGIYTLILDDETVINNASNNKEWRDYVRSNCNTAKDISEIPKSEIAEVLDEEITEDEVDKEYLTTEDEVIEDGD